MPASRPISLSGSARARRLSPVIAAGCMAAAVFVGGGGRPWAEEPPANLPVPALEVPALLTPADVGRGLRGRLDVMADGEAQRQARRAAEAPRDYAPPDVVEGGPLPPDVPGGDADLERAGGGE